MAMALSLAFLAALTIFSSGCSQRMYSQEEQSCVETYSLQEVLAGVHGVDQYGRPLNACGYPVNVYGEVIEDDICPEVFYHQPDYMYLNWLSMNYGFYHPIWGVGFFHPCSGPRIFHREYFTGVIRPTCNYRRTTVVVTEHAPIRNFRRGNGSYNNGNRNNGNYNNGNYNNRRNNQRNNQNQRTNTPIFRRQNNGPVVRPMPSGGGSRTFPSGGNNRQFPAGGGNRRH